MEASLVHVEVEADRCERRSVGRMGKWFLLLLVIGQSLVGVDAASENAPKNKDRWKECKELGTDEDGKCRSGMQKEPKNGKVYLTKWFHVELGEEVHEKVQRYF